MKLNFKTDIGSERNVAVKRPDIVAQVKTILDNVRTDAEIWPLNDKKRTMPF